MITAPDGVLTFSLLRAIPGVHHAFVPADALGGYDAGRPGHVDRLARLGANRIARTHQTHSARVVHVRETVGNAGLGVDGLITAATGLALHAISADCPLLFIATRDGRSVGIAHCGWRGIAAGIVKELLKRLRSDLGVPPAELVAGISPAASACCYEVGEEVLEELARAGVPLARCVHSHTRADATAGSTVDLKEAIRSLLVAGGVSPDSIEVAPDCTICGGDRFHSFRRQGNAAGRMSGAIAALGG